MKKGQSFSLLSQGNPNSITRGGQPPADESGVKKAQQPSLKKSADNSSLSSSSPPMASPHLEEKTKKQQQQKKKKSTKVLDPTTIKYVPPPPSAPPEWAVELPKPMEENRFVLDVSKKEKQALKRLGSLFFVSFFLNEISFVFLTYLFSHKRNQQQKEEWGPEGPQLPRRQVSLYICPRRLAPVRPNLLASPADHRDPHLSPTVRVCISFERWRRRRRRWC